MAKYKLNDIAPIQQGDVPKADEFMIIIKENTR